MDNKKKKILIKVAIGSLSSLVLISALSIVSTSAHKKAIKTIEEKDYTINYGNINFSGEYLDLFNKNNIRVFVTTEGEYKVIIKDSNNNYFVIEENMWYKRYISDGIKVTLVNQEGLVLCGVVDWFNKYLNEEEKGKKSFSTEELMDIEDRLNNKELKLTLK